MGGRVRQRVVANLGRIEELQEGPIDRLIEHLMRFSQRQWELEKARQIEAGQARTWGPVLIFRRLWEELGLAATFRRLLEGTAVETDFEEATFAMGDPPARDGEVLSISRSLLLIPARKEYPGHRTTGLSKGA
ncbi:hypothetical protein V3F56_07060 [Moorellaceae bacterium AZ2]